MQAVYSQTGLTIRVDAGEAHFDTNLGGRQRNGTPLPRPSCSRPREAITWAPGPWKSLAATWPTTAARLRPRLCSRPWWPGCRWTPIGKPASLRPPARSVRSLPRPIRKFRASFKSTFEYQQKTQDAALKCYNRGAIRGQVLLEDPNTGQRYEVPNRSKYYWRSSASSCSVCYWRGSVRPRRWRRSVISWPVGDALCCGSSPRRRAGAPRGRPRRAQCAGRPPAIECTGALGRPPGGWRRPARRAPRPKMG